MEKVLNELINDIDKKIQELEAHNNDTKEGPRFNQEQANSDLDKEKIDGLIEKIDEKIKQIEEK